jgi:hypothetical protein
MGNGIEQAASENAVNRDKMAQSLARFYSGEREARNEIDKYLKNNGQTTEPQLFIELSKGKGRPSTHTSGKYIEGKRKLTGFGKRIRRRKNRLNY